MTSLNLKLKTKSGQIIVNTLTSLNTIAELKAHIASVTKIPVSNLYILFGFPPKPLDLASNEKNLQGCGLKSGDTLIVEEKVDKDNEHRLHIDSQRLIIEQEYADSRGILMKQVVPADNSCLFTSIGFVLEGKVDTGCGSYMRQIIAETVSNDEENYSEAILGKPNRDYCNWILKPDSWGGAIELAVLSKFYGIEIAVVDTVNAIINRFGEDQRYDQRVFLIFNGIHYDPLYLEPIEPSGSVQTIFSTLDDRILQEAEQLAIEAKSSRQYTDVNHLCKQGQMRCLVCDIILIGQAEVSNHAKASGHINYISLNS